MLSKLSKFDKLSKFYRIILRKPKLEDRLNVQDLSEFSDLKKFNDLEKKLITYSFCSNTHLNSIISREYFKIIDKKKELIKTEKEQLESTDSYFFNSIFDALAANKTTKNRFITDAKFYINQSKECAINLLDSWIDNLTNLECELFDLKHSNKLASSLITNKEDENKTPHSITNKKNKPQKKQKKINHPITNKNEIKLLSDFLDEQNKILNFYNLTINNSINNLDQFAKLNFKNYEIKKKIRLASKFSWSAIKFATKSAIVSTALSTTLLCGTYIWANEFYKTLPRPNDSKFVILVSKPTKSYEIFAAKFIDFYTLRVSIAMGQQAEYVIMPAYKADLFNVITDESVQNIAILSHGSWSSCTLTDEEVFESELIKFTKYLPKKNGYFLRHMCSSNIPSTEKKIKIKEEVIKEIIRDVREQDPEIFFISAKFFTNNKKEKKCNIYFYDYLLNKKKPEEINQELGDLQKSYANKIIDENLYYVNWITPEDLQLGASVMKYNSQVHGWKGTYLVGPQDWFLDPIPSANSVSMCTKYPLLKKGIEFILPLLSKNSAK